MELTLSVFFNIDRTYLTVVENDPKGLSLVHINSTINNVDLSDFAETGSQVVLEEIQKVLQQIGRKVDRVTVTLPSESVLVSQFPGKPDLSEEELKQLVSLEIRQSYPQFNYEDFTVSIVPFAERKDVGHMLMAVIIPNAEYTACKQLLKSLDQPIDNIEISQLTAHNAFLYNYPERKEGKVILMGVQDQFIDISVIDNGLPAYYNLFTFNDKAAFGQIFEDEFNRINAEITDGISAAFFFGSGLTKDIFISGWETSMLLGIESMRLNAFRMVKTDLDQRTREYCSRMLHVYPPCIGGSLPAYHKRIKLY